MRLIDADDLERRIMMMPDDVLCEDCCYNVVNVIDAMPNIATGINVHNKWISANNKLPEKSGYYLVFFSNGMPSCKMRVHNWIKDEHHWRGAEAFSMIEGITHWMPLPEPPEEREEDAYI